MAQPIATKGNKFCFPQAQNKTFHWLTPLDLHHRVKKDQLGDIHDSGIVSFGRALLPCLRVNLHGHFIRRLCLSWPRILLTIRLYLVSF